MKKTKVKTKIPGGSKEVTVAPLVERKHAAVYRRNLVKVPKTTALPGDTVGKKKKVLTDRELVWDSGLKIVNPPILIDVPQSIADVIRAIEKQIVGNVEFSIYVKADISDIECIRISEDYYVPRQVVSHGSVDYNDVPPDGYNAVIHKHPRGVMTFSGTDDEYINANFGVSMLWCNGDFVDATVNYDAGAGVKLQLEGYVHVDDERDLPEVDVGNISVLKQKTAKHVHLHPQHHYPGCHVPGTEQSAIDAYAEQFGLFQDEEHDFMDPGEDENFSLVGRPLRVGME